MFRTLSLSFLLISLNFAAFAQVPLTYYLPSSTTYSSDIPTPESIIGHQVGEWHVSHDKLVQYMYALADASDRISIEETGRTYENRPLLLLKITSPSNQANIEDLRKKHLVVSDPTSSSVNPADAPAVVYMGYSIHGNEASGSNAALLVAYHLAAAQGEEINKLLDNTVILLDPSFNPDGLNRFASWVNSRKSAVLNADPNHVEFSEPWPRGRTNHYWFDLNRDWLPVQLPESQARLKVFHAWKPNILTDHHEMGTNATFFFQPGIPSRNNPLTPQETYRLTAAIGEFHAEALDEIGSLYYTNESYDDYYYGKGSTYPDINGAVGILFEQASSRGHAQENDLGVLTFPFTIRNQFTTSLSTMKAAVALHDELLIHQKKFYQDALKEAAADKDKVYLIGSKDRMRTFHLGELINRHDIDVFHLKEGTTINSVKYQKDELLAIPLDQPQYRLIKAMFETRTSFQDSLFYDISTWTLPLAFGVDYRAGGVRDVDLVGSPFNVDQLPKGELVKKENTYAYVFEWHEYYAPRMLNALLAKGYKVRVAHEPFNSEGKTFPPGSLVVPVSAQSQVADSVFAFMKKLAELNHINVYSATTGLDYQGKSLGSPSFSAVEKPGIVLLVDEGVRSYDAGEIWHLLDQRYEIPVTLLSVNSVSSADLSRYNTMIMVDGNYRAISESGREKLKRWTQEGGTIVAFGDALAFLNSAGLGSFPFIQDSDKDSVGQKPYRDLSPTEGAQEIGGAIFKAKVDLTHPLLYGYYHETMPLFKNDENFLKPSDNSFANPMLYTSEPLISGYISKPNLKKLSNSSVAGIDAVGSGRVIGFTSNLAFRAFWFGSNKVFMNAIFFGREISSRATR
jgi:hypothetical protein